MLYSLRRLFAREPGGTNKNQKAAGNGSYPTSSPAAAAAAARLTGAGQAGGAPSNSSVLDRIAAAMEEVRPAIRMDGGDIELVGFDGPTGTVTIRLKGACRSCPMSEMTLQLGIERVLKALVPEVERVEAV